MVADDLGRLSGGEGHGGQVIGDLLTLDPALTTGIKDVGVAVYFNQGAEVIVPAFSASAGRQGPDPGGAPLNPGMLTDLMAVMPVHRGLRRVGRGEVLITRGLVGLELDQHVIAGSSDDLNRFLGHAGHLRDTTVRIDLTLG